MYQLILIAAALAASSAAQAHVGVGDTNSFVHGLAHPMGGVDHVLAMLAVGIFAAHLGGRALYLVPLAFVFMMIAGGAVGMAGVSLPFVEAGIGLSVLVFGMAIAFSLDVPTAVAMMLVGSFAIFHGHAHGAEMPGSASGLEYGAGFIFATVTLHVVGMALGLIAREMSPVLGKRILQTAGGAMSLTGVALLAGYV